MLDIEKCYEGKNSKNVSWFKIRQIYVRQINNLEICNVDMHLSQKNNFALYFILVVSCVERRPSNSEGGGSRPSNSKLESAFFMNNSDYSLLSRFW